MNQISMNEHFERIPDSFFGNILYSILYFLLKLPLITASVLVYCTTSQLFRMPFQQGYFALSLLFAYFPFLDYLPYQLFKRKLRLVSHQLWYLPLLYIPVGAVIVAWIAAKMNLAAPLVILLFIGNSASHFFLAAVASPHGISLFPLRWYLHITHEGFILLSPEQHRRTLDQAGETVCREYNIFDPWERSWRQELDSRKSLLDPLTLALFGIALLFALLVL